MLRGELLHLLQVRVSSVSQENFVFISVNKLKCKLVLNISHPKFYHPVVFTIYWSLVLNCISILTCVALFMSDTLEQTKDVAAVKPTGTKSKPHAAPASRR